MNHEEEKWHIACDGSFTHQGGGTGVVMYDFDGIDFSISFKLKFPCPDNEAECEAFIIRLISTLQMGIRRLLMQ